MTSSPRSHDSRIGDVTERNVTVAGQLWGGWNRPLCRIIGCFPNAISDQRDHSALVSARARHLLPDGIWYKGGLNFILGRP